MDLHLQDFLRRVLVHNESLQVRLLEVEIGKKRVNAERGVFEPQFFASGEHSVSKRENTVQQLVSSSFLSVFSEKNNLYSGGLESLVPSGARIRLAYSLSDLSNNLQQRQGRTNGEYQTFFGLNVVQPLLRNFGHAATLAGVRLAALTSEVAFQEYRKQMMQVITSAEAAYWNLYLAQEQLRFFNDSVKMAETILRDNRERAKAGKSSELEVLEAESGLALRRSKRTDAEQNHFEAISRLTSLYSSYVVSSNTVIHAIDEPTVSEEPRTFLDGWSLAFEQNPDYLAQRKRVIMEGVRLAYARNQLWPQLDLKASYGLNGLGTTPGESWDDIERHDFRAWSVGFEFRIPLAGNLKAKNELGAAKLRQKQVLISLKEIETQIANALDIAIRRGRHARDSVTNHQAVARYGQNLLDSQLASLEVGKIDSRSVLETETAVFEAKNAVVESMVQYRRALLESELISGSTLLARAMEFSQRELESKTALILKERHLTDQQYQEFLDALKTQYESKTFPRPPEERDEALEVLRKFIQEQELLDWPDALRRNTNAPSGPTAPSKPTPPAKPDS